MKDKTRVASRPTPAFTSTPNSDDESINDIVFEALGSKVHAQDLVLCNKDVNLAKMRFWSNNNPYDPGAYEQIARDASNGAIPSEYHFSAYRNVRVSYRYQSPRCAY